MVSAETLMPVAFAVDDDLLPIPRWASVCFHEDPGSARWIGLTWMPWHSLAVFITVDDEHC